MEFRESQHKMFICFNFIIRLTTCFGHFAGPSSGHKTYKEEKKYRVSRKILSKIQRDLVVV